MHIIRLGIPPHTMQSAVATFSQEDFILMLRMEQNKLYIMDAMVLFHTMPKLPGKGFPNCTSSVELLQNLLVK